MIIENANFERNSQLICRNSRKYAKNETKERENK